MQIQLHNEGILSYPSYLKKMKQTIKQYFKEKKNECDNENKQDKKVVYRKLHTQFKFMTEMFIRAAATIQKLFVNSFNLEIS